MRSRLGRIAVVLGIAGLLGVALIGLLTATPAPADRVHDLEQRLRCPVCKSVSIAESPSETAQAMRTVVAEQVAAGRSDAEIVDYFRARYGDWVLLDPPATGSTLPLWLLPAAAAATGLAVLLRLRTRQAGEPAAQLTAEQRDRVARELDRARARAQADEGGETA